MSLPKPRKYTIEQLIEAVTTSFSLRQVLFKLGLVEAGGNYQSIKSAIKRLNLNIDHFNGKAHLKGKTHNWVPTKSWNEVLIKNSMFQLHPAQRKRLFNDGLLPQQCSKCKILNEMARHSACIAYRPY